MATIKAIEAQSVHQIQSGQVIVDLCSVVKELVENGLDAGATSIEVRFKNNGLDAIEVQDNGTGISPANYESVALKHHTSKLSVYDDLSSLQTFGFRGEALSSLCALSTFYMTTAQADEAPKGRRLDFEVSGNLKSTSVVACQKGTTATVEGLFESLPVRRKELTKNIKREYGKVIGLLHAYACVSTGVRFAVKSAMPKGSSMTVFATKANTATRDNIANVYGAKTLQALVALDLELDLQPSSTQAYSNSAQATRIKVTGHISRPVWGEGRQTPDRQMFFVNGRPCGLPQVAKVMNEVYKSFNVSQSPFIFADFQMDTNAYDVNVSPDKRTILLHNAADLIEKLREVLDSLFEKQDQTVPQSQVSAAKLPAFKQLAIQRAGSTGSAVSGLTLSKGNSTRLETTEDVDSNDDEDNDEEVSIKNRLHDHFRAQTSTREESVTRTKSDKSKIQNAKGRRADKIAQDIAAQEGAVAGFDEYDDVRDMQDVLSRTKEDSDDSEEDTSPPNGPGSLHVRTFNQRMSEQQQTHRTVPKTLAEDSVAAEGVDTQQSLLDQADQHDQPNVVQNAFDHMRPQRARAEIATITIGDHTTTAVVGSGFPSQKRLHSSKEVTSSSKKQKLKSASTLQFSQSLRKFEAARTHTDEEHSVSEEQSAASEEAEVDRSEDESPQSLEDRSVSSSEADNSDEGEGEDYSQDQDEAADETEDVEAEDDPDYVNRAGERAEEKARVAELIRLAEETATKPSKDSLRRINQAMKASIHKDSTTNLVARVDITLDDFATSFAALQNTRLDLAAEDVTINAKIDSATSDEEKLTLTISKSDFASMAIIGQFNLGFILAVRHPSAPAGETSSPSASPPTSTDGDELFIIDQHASDEKYNFERLQASTVVSNQRLVRPVTLELTSVEEEIVLENLAALEKNGFVVETDTSGDVPIGQRCKLLTLPVSKEVTFDTRDLDELIHLLSENPTGNVDGAMIPRPSKVRKMFAMRACRSSIMIGKTLSLRQMGDVLRHMGEIEKPWNCPHGRPTMRHLASLGGLGGWDAEGGGDEWEVWREYASAADDEDYE